ncbi:AAA family ATPase, partial [Streptomyces albus]
MPYAVLRSPRSSRFVGRRDELGALCAALAAAPSVAFVEGEAGIGKTRLIHEALARTATPGRRVLAGNCLPLREPFPYGPVVDLFRGLGDDLPRRLNPVCGALRSHVPELAAALPPAPEPAADHRATQHRLFRAVRALLEALGDT